MSIELLIKEIESKHRVFFGNRMVTLDKTAGFLDDERFMTIFNSLDHSKYDEYDAPHTIAWKLHTLVWAAQSAAKLDGDFVECGVYKGKTSWMVAKMLDFDSLDKKFYLYDTFMGFSDKYSSADDYPDDSGFLAFAQKSYSDPNIYPAILELFCSYKNVEIIKGVLPDCLTERSPEKIAYLHIDLNSPAAELGVLNTLFNRVVPGGYVVLDDYGWHVFRRQKEVEDRFFKERNYSVLELPTGQGLVIKR